MSRNLILLATSALAFLFSGYLVFIHAPKVSVSEKESKSEILTQQAYSFLKDFGDPQIQDSLYVENLARWVSRYQRIESDYIGLAGWTSRQFDPVYSFNKLATRSQLVKLINTGNPVLQHYAFIALRLKDPTLSKKVFVDHLNDTKTVDMIYGCSFETRPINIDFFLTLNVILTPDEYDLYKNKVHYIETFGSVNCEFASI